MNVVYLSSSIIPSKTANSVNVMKMCQAFAQNGHNVILAGIKGEENVDPFKYYNVEKIFKLKLAKGYRGVKVINIFYRLYMSFKAAMCADIIYSRWALAAFMIVLISNKKVVFEYHHLPKGLINTIIEYFLVRSKSVIKHVFITNVLRRDYMDKFPILERRKTAVLPDGADIHSVADSADDFKFKNSKQKLECAYIGSFYKGKGIEIVIELAKRMPNINFHVVGGTDDEISCFKSTLKSENIKWHGYLSHKEAMSVLNKVDIALLPNQKKIIIGDKKTDIGRWTSPMKLFEYMAFGKAIIASDLTVIREILNNKENAILVSPTNIDEWVCAVDELQNNQELFDLISCNAKNDLESKYSWKIRAKKSLEI